MGIDCSGFVSRVWDQKVKYSTISITKSFRELGKDFNFDQTEKYQSMKKGDAFNIYRYHVMLCAEDNPFTGDETEALVYEASGNDWKVWDRGYTFKQLTHKYLSKSRPDESYYPYSPLKQIDIDLIIDRSGSMGWDYKMDDAKKAAAMFVSMMGENDKIGVVSFNSSAQVDYKLTEITEYDKDNPSEIKQAAINAINEIRAGGGTSIGAGMETGFNQLKTYGVDNWGNKDDVRTMILMSDGHSSSTESVLNKIVAYNETYKNNKIKVCTIGFGSGANQDLLSDIASKTDCSYQYATNLLDLYFTYRSLQMEVAGEDMLKLSNKIRIIKDEISRIINIDSTVGTATFAIAWEGSDLDLTLIRPDGTTVDHDTNDPDIEFMEGDTYEFYKINAPMHGEWEMVVKAIDVPAGGEDFIITVSGESAMIFEANLDKQKYSQGEKIVITAFAQDPIMDTNDPQYVSNAKFDVIVTKPNQTTSTFWLYDDGNHNDGGADDGIYANTFDDTGLSGSYTFNIKASGNTNRAGDPFTREKSISTFVKKSEKKNVIITVTDKQGFVFDEIILEAEIKGENGEVLTGDSNEVNFKVNNNIIGSATTDGSGKVELPWTVNLIPVNLTEIYPITVSFAGNENHLSAEGRGDFTLQGAKQLKQDALTKLENIQSNNKQIQNDINKAVKNINSSLNSELWIDASHLDSKRGHKVFDREKQAVKSLLKIIKEKEKHNDFRIITGLQTVIDGLLKTDMLLTMVAIYDAENIQTDDTNLQKKIDSEINKAKEELEKALQKANENNPDKAIDYFKKSWNSAQLAIDFLLDKTNRWRNRSENPWNWQ